MATREPFPFLKGREIALVAVVVSPKCELYPATRKIPKLFAEVNFPRDDWHQWLKVIMNYIEVVMPLEEESIWIPRFQLHDSVDDVSHRKTYLGILRDGRLQIRPISLSCGN